MPNPTITGTTGNDNIRFANYGQPSTTNTYTLNLLAGTDTFDLVTGNSYASRFVSTNFTIGAADANGMITVTGASTGGRDHFTFNLTSVESIVFKDKTVQLSYGTPVTPTDTTPPTVSNFSPQAGATGVGVAINIVLTFSEAVQLSSGLIEVHSGSANGGVVATNAATNPTESLTVSGTTLTINPTADLSNGTDYYVTLAQGSIQDLAGNGYSGTTAYHFSTVATALTPPTVIPTTALPADGSSYTAPALAGVGILGILSWVLL